MASQNQDPNQPILDSIDALFNRMQQVSPFNEMGGVMSVEVPQEMPIGNGQIQPVGFIAPSAIDTSDLFADDIMPPAVVAALPTLPDASYPPGRLAFLTTDGKLYRNDEDVWTTSVDGADIIANSITAGQIAAGAIGADQLAAQIVLASQILTAVSGARIELDEQGIRVYSATEALLFNAPTDGSDLYVNAEIAALGLSVSGDAVFQGTGNSLAIGSVTTAEASVTKPTQAPTLAQGWDTLSLPIDSSVDKSTTKYTRRGLAFDTNGGAGGGTAVIWQLSTDSAGEVTLLELLASDRSVNRSLGLGDDELGILYPTVARLSNWVYIYYSNFNGNWTVDKYLASDLSFVATYAPSLPGDAARASDHAIASDGTNLFIAGPDEFGVLKINKYDATLVKQGSTINTTHAPSGSSTRAAALYAGNADFGAARFAIMVDSGSVYLYDSTGSNQPNETFDTPGTAQSPGPSRGLTYGNIEGDGARFWSLGAISNVAETTIGKHSTWVWTSASSKYWVAYSWYDDAGTTHETEVGPRASITMGRRKKLTVTTAALPGTGGADDPNKRRVYMVPKSTTPATTELKLQNAMADSTTVERTYDSGGAAPQTSNGFAGLGSAAEIKSATTGWSLKGDGTSSFKQVAHLMYKNSNQSIGTGTASFVKIASYDGTTRTNSAYFSNTTGVITLLQAGLYKIVCQAAFASNATGRRYLGVGLNGADPLNRNRVSQNANSSGGTHLGFSMFLDAAANDTVQMMVEQDSGGNLNMTDGIFQIVWLGT